MNRTFRLALCAFFASLLVWSAQANAGVTVTPNTLLIEGRDRYADLTLINAGDAPNTYEMGWKFFRMEEDTGKYINVQASVTPFDLTQNAVFTPRRITLLPGKAQKVRLALRLKGEPPAPGDYRGHFELREVPSLSSDTTADQKAPSVGVKIKVGFTIPVVYRVGESDATATIGKVRTQLGKNGKIEIVIPITKSAGPYGILGNLAIFYNVGGTEKRICGLSNANIFPEITRRTFVIPLKTEALNSGALRIVYRDRQEGKELIYAEKTIPIGK